MTTTTKLIVAAAFAATGGLAASAYAGDCCASGSKAEKLAEGQQFISTTADDEAADAVDDSGQVVITGRAADEILAELENAQSYEEAEPLLKEFIEAHPENEQSAQFIYVLASRETDQEKKLEMYRTLVEKHPDTQFAQMAKGSLKQMEQVGQPFELTFEELRTGEQMNLQEDLKGKVVVIDFWATWCGPCIAEMPNMKELYSQYKDQGVEFVGISLDAPPSEGGRDKLLAYVEENDVEWPQYYQGNGWDSEFSKSWGVSSIPQLFIIDADGKLHSTEARGQLETLIPKLIAQRDGAEGEMEEMEAEGTDEAAMAE